MLGVTGGPTGAGTKRVKTLDLWQCKCPNDMATSNAFDILVFRSHPGEKYSCPDCGERRPDAS